MVNKLVLNEAAYFGSNARNEIPRIIKEHKFKNVLVVTQKELIDLGVATKVTELLSQQGINYSIFDEVQENPTVSNVKAGIIKAKEILADVIVAVGGGSAIDTAKAIGVVLTNPEFEDITSLEGAVTNNRCIPIIAVSTTSGTAAEVTINKKLEQLKKIQEEIAFEKQKIEQDFGKEIIITLNLDYDQLTKKEMKRLANQFKNNLEQSHVSNSDNPNEQNQYDTH